MFKNSLEIILAYWFILLRETMNPRDIVTDAIHNFHPQESTFIVMFPKYTILEQKLIYF